MTDQIVPTPSSETPPPSESLSIQFKGNAKDFSKIWIRNALLSILSLGFYSPWATVENRRYLFTHTSLKDSAFDFHGDPRRILVGRMILIFAGALYFIGGRFYPKLALAAYLLFAVTYPWILVQSQSFRLRNTSYRGVRFGFKKDFKESYKVHGLALVLLLATCGIAVPYGIFLTSRFRFSHSRFGQGEFKFDGESGFYMKTMWAGYAIALVFVFLAMGIAIMAKGAFPPMISSLVIGIFMYLPLIFVGGYITAKITNYNFSHLSLNGIQFESEIDPVDYGKIYLGNLVISACTLGIGAPWCIIRTTEYRLSKLKVKTPPGALDQFIQDPQALEEAKKGAWLDGQDIDFGV